VPYDHDTPFTERWPEGWPPLDRITDAHIEPAVHAVIAERAAALATVRDSGLAPSFADVVAIERAHTPVRRVEQVWSVLLTCSGTPARHELAAVVAPLLAEAEADVWLDPHLYARVAAVHARRTELGLDQEDAALLNRIHHQFLRAGAHLDERARHDLRALATREATLRATIEARLSSGLQAAAVHLTTRAELAGLDPDTIDRAATAAAERGLDGWLLTLSGPAEQPVLEHLDDPAVRRRVHEASITRCSRGDEHDTHALVLELVRVRATRARLLGYPHHLAYTNAGLAGRAARLAQAVPTLLRDLVPVAAHAALAEDAALGVTDAAPWDRPYLAARARTGQQGQEQNQAPDVDLRDYLPLTAVLDGAQALIHTLHGIQFRDRPDLPVHEPDAGVWQAVDHDGRVLGLVLLDLHRRPGKRPGAWATEMVAQSHLDGQRAVVALSLNLPPTTPNGRPVLLTLAEAARLWHELGHVVHAMVSEVRYPDDSGFAQVPRVVVEAPSVVQEMWARQPDILAGYARHHRTGAPLPAAAAARLADSQHGGARQLAVDAASYVLDQACHTITADQDIPNLAEFQRRVLADAGLAHVQPRYPVSFFRHILTGDYDAQYGSYTVSDVLSAQLHTTFAALGGPSRAVGDQLRPTLATGATDPDQYLDLVGGRLDPRPLLARLGLTGPAAAQGRSGDVGCPLEPNSTVLLGWG
jgi:peptidyl-dipeptidase Dcp